MKKRNVFSSLTAFFLGVLAIISVPCSVSAVTAFIVTGTADRTGLVYTSGETYTFTLTLADGFTHTPASSFTGSDNNWVRTQSSEARLFASIIGDGLVGTYTPPATVFSSIETNDTVLPGISQTEFGASSVVVSPTASIGMTVDGNNLLSIALVGLGAPVNYT